MMRSISQRRLSSDQESLLVNEVYANFEYLRQLTGKRFKDAVLSDEAYSYAFEGLSRDNWRRVRAYKGKSTFRTYLGTVWCRLLEDFSVKKFGKRTVPRWIQTLGGVWEELFKLLCCRWFSIAEAAETILDAGRYAGNAAQLEDIAGEILAAIPTCGQKAGTSYSLDGDNLSGLNEILTIDNGMQPDELAIQKEKWIALQALADTFFKISDHPAREDGNRKQLSFLISDIRKHLPLTPEEQLILTTHFVDDLSVTDIGKRLGYNPNQIHGKFRRLMDRLRKTLPDLIEPYFK